MAETFGEMFKRLRIESGQTLRAFCLRHKLDPGNISKLERGRMSPPESDEVLTEYAKDLKLKRDSEQWQSFFDAAAAERGTFPSDLLEDQELIDKLPVLFRALRGVKNGEALDKLVEKIRRA